VCSSDLAEAQPDPAKVPDLDVDDLKKQLSVVMLQPDHAPHYDKLADKLLYAYIGFQIDHPKLARTMEQLAADLAAAGF